MERLKQQVEFAIEIDKVKNVFRQSYLTDGQRKENDAEHAWHAALMAVLLSEYSNEPVDLLKVVKMILIHDLVEIDAGDSYAYDTAAQATAREREVKAAERIFSILPEDQKQEYRALWDEFEDRRTAEARYARVMDNLQPLLLNHASNGKSWREHGVEKAQVMKRNERVAEGSEELYHYIEEIVEENVKKGNLRP